MPAMKTRVSYLLNDKQIDTYKDFKEWCLTRALKVGDVLPEISMMLAAKIMHGGVEFLEYYQKIK